MLGDMMAVDLGGCRGGVGVVGRRGLDQPWVRVLV